MIPRIILLELTNQSSQILTNYFTQFGYEVSSCRLSTEISQHLADRHIEFLIVNANLPHPTLLKHIHSAVKQHAVPVVMFVKSSDKLLTEEAVRAGVSALVVDGFEVNRLRHILDIAKARFDETQRLNGEMQKLKIQLLDRKSIDKAKGILMKRRAIDENAAFGLIQKMAIDRNQNMIQVARNIIDVDELQI